MSNNKKFLALGLMPVLCLLALTGCSSNKNSQTNSSANNQGQNFTTNKNFDNQPGGRNFTLDLPKGSATDLQVGAQVMVLGSNETQGVITARQILVGSQEKITDFFKNNLNKRPTTTPDGTGTPTNGQTPPTGTMQPSQTPPSGTMAPAGGDSGSASQTATQRRSRSGLARISGQIIKNENNTLTLQLTEGGSRIVLYSDQTTIYLVK
jgi:hypothetical protein